MARDYAAMTTLVTTKLQSAGTMDYTVAEVKSQIEEVLKELPNYSGFRHLVPVTFKIESRYGTASTVSANNLVDSTKGQFAAADSTEEKVVHNTTDNKRAVVLSFASTASIGISADIFVEDDQYRIYNKQCWNKKQIYLGDMADYLPIHSVEYPIGQRRNWIIPQPGILELDIDGGAIKDSNAGSTITQLPDVDVLVRFNKPHVLSQLTDLVGNVAASAAAGATTLSGSALQTAGTIAVGEEFRIENHRTLYMVAETATIASNTVAITFYPALEAAIAGTTWVITFVKSSLSPSQEEILATRAAGHLAVNKSPKFFDAVSIGGASAGQQLQNWGQERLAETERKLQGQSPPKVNKSYSRE